MGKLKQFSVAFTDNKVVYVPGDTISGEVVVDLFESMNMTALNLTFAGKARVHWTERHKSGKHTTTRHYSANQTLFEQLVVLHGRGAIGPNERRELGKGRHVYPFTFQLPNPLPSSFESHIGYIRYYVKGTIVKPWKFNHNTKAAFTVLDMLDLNIVPNMLNPSGSINSKVLCCMCCASAPIEAEFHLDRTGYVPGEWIIINATVKNGSNSKVLQTSADLIQRVSYHATSKTKVVTNNLGRVIGPGCAARGTVNWVNERLHIPPLPPSESAHCRIIDIHYFVQFQAHLRTFAVNLYAEAPIVIGTVPLRNLQLYSNAPPAAPQQPTAPPPQAIISQPPPTNDSLMPPPPSYAMATEGMVDIKDDDDNDYTMGEMSYTPQYTYYNWNESAFTYNK